MRKYLTLIGLMLLSVVSCKREGDNKPYVPLNPDLKRNYSFKVGSYWIYRDSLSGREDSFYVTRYVLNQHQEEQSYFQEAAVTYVAQHNVFGGYTDTAEWGLILFNGTFITIEYDHWPSREFYYPSYITTQYPLIGANNLINYSMLNIRGVNYNNVAAVFIRPKANPANDGWLYFKDSIGLLKMNFNLDTIHHIWELERYHINY